MYGLQHEMEQLQQKIKDLEGSGIEQKKVAYHNSYILQKNYNIVKIIYCLHIKTRDNSVRTIIHMKAYKQ